MSVIKLYKMSKRTFTLTCFILLLLCVSVTARAQNHALALAAADTSNFSKNSDGGWLLYNSFVAARGTDSVRLELILQHDNNISWAQEQYVGKIKVNNLRPNSVKTISFSLVGITYQLRIDTNGKCYLKVIAGTAPVGSPVVIPLSLLYKK